MRLAAELRIVATTSDAVDDGPVTISCLASSSLHRKRPTTEPASLAFRRRAVSTIFSTDGSIAATQHYLVTDSVEPPPVHVPRVQRAPKLEVRRKLIEGIVETKRLRREVQNSRPKPIAWGPTGGVSLSSPIDVLETPDDAPTTVDRIIQDITHPIKAGDSVRATHMISTAGHSWDGKRIPTSTSFILPK
jgi:hypothetical protein